MPLDATLWIQHRLSDEEVQYLCTVLEDTLQSMGIEAPQIMISITPDDPKPVDAAR